MNEKRIEEAVKLLKRAAAINPEEKGDAYSFGAVQQLAKMALIELERMEK